MSKRMWAAADGQLETKSARGYFDLVYGNESDKQKLDIWLPDQEQDSYPVIIAIHGGGFTVLDKQNSEISNTIKESLRRGYAVASLNYRMNDEAVFPYPVRDIKQAVRFLRKNGEKYQLDTEKMITWGGSAGGYFALMAALTSKEIYFDNDKDENIHISASVKGAVVWYGITDFSNMDEQMMENSIINKYLRTEFKDVNECYVNAFPESEEDEFPFHNSPDSADSIFLGEKYGMRKKNEQMGSPVSYINSEIPPILLQHGSGDEIIPMQQSIEFAIKANKMCTKERVICEIIPHAIHGSLLFETKENYDRVFDFIKTVI